MSAHLHVEAFKNTMKLDLDPGDLARVPVVPGRVTHFGPFRPLTSELLAQYHVLEKKRAIFCRGRGLRLTIPTVILQQVNQWLPNELVLSTTTSTTSTPIRISMHCVDLSRARLGGGGRDGAAT